jgi:hypothetical protein
MEDEVSALVRQWVRITTPMGFCVNELWSADKTSMQLRNDEDGICWR